MQRKRGELVPIGDAPSGMDGPVKAIRDASPQARHHFTQADQGDGSVLPTLRLNLWDWLASLAI